MPRRARLQHQPGHRRADRVLLTLRASRAAVPRPRLHRLHRPRGDHRHLQADPTRAGLRAALHRAGEGRRADRRRAGAGVEAARRGRPSQRHAPMHPDARRARGPLAHLDQLLARQLRDRPAAQVRVPGSGGPNQQTLNTPAPLLEAFEVLYEAEGLPSYLLPFELERIYAGIGFKPLALYSNFVSSIDGVVTLGEGTSAGSVISGKYPADRFLMALLRACADAVLIGAGTLRATPGHRWTPSHVYPDLASSFDRLRRTLGRQPEPRLLVLTATGELDASHPAVVKGATVVTTPQIAKSLRARLPKSCDVIESGEAEVDIKAAFRELGSRGIKVVLTEGGPHVMGELITNGLLDEVFLTVSPVVAGRNGGGRLGMVGGSELLPSSGVWSILLSSRRHGDYLFLRYGLRKSARP